MSTRTRWVIGSLTAAGLAAGGMLFSARPAQAQAAYGSYIGIGVSVGLTRDNNSEGNNFSGLIAGRYRILEAPISLRAQAMLTGNSTAIIPTVSYDFPLNWQTDAYIGAGVAFTGGEIPSPVGDTTSFVLQPGIDYAVPNTNVTMFGNAIIAFDAYRNGGGVATSIQGGVGVQF